MPTARLHTRLPAALIDRLERWAKDRALTKSDVVEAALESFFSPDAGIRRDAEFTRRLDRLHRQLETLRQELAVAIESQALFVRYYLSATAPLPADQQAAARAQGKERFESFVRSLARRLERGKSLVRDLHAEIYPASAAFLAGDGDPATGNAEDDHATP